MATRGKLTVVEGMAISEAVAANWDEIYNFPARPEDVLIDTYPKSGTTWMQEIVDLIVHDGNEEICQRGPIFERVPFIEFCHVMKPGMEEIEAMPSPRILKTHLPVQLVPPSFWRHKCKVIYVARNAKDTLTSYFHFDKYVKVHPDPESFENYVQRFMKGDVAWGSWYDHVKDFWDARNKHNILYVFYEELKKNPQQEIRKLAKFLGKELSEDVLNKIAKLTSFEVMKTNPMANASGFPKEIVDESEKCFMRKGKVGDWKTMFSAQQLEIFEADYKRQMSNTTLTFSDKI